MRVFPFQDKLYTIYTYENTIIRKTNLTQSQCLLFG